MGYARLCSKSFFSGIYTNPFIRFQGRQPQLYYSMPLFDTWPITLDVALVFLAVALLLRLGPKYLASRSLILPPGPEGLPWVGNLRMLHQAQQRKWEVYAQWSKRWGKQRLLEWIS